MQSFIWQVKTFADSRWSKTKKNLILNSRVKGTKLLAEYFANSNQKPRLIISASALGFYGDRGAEIVDEDSKVGNGFLANVCVQWEDALKVTVEAGIRVIKVRFGTVLSKKGGALKNSAAVQIGARRYFRQRGAIYDLVPY